jgi:phosphomannomutase
MTDLECYINAVGFLYFVKQNNGYSSGTVYLAGDLRDSTPRILAAMHQAITDSGFETVYCGLIPTPAVALHALQSGAPCIMVTGSHIPEDRNGIKFYKVGGEILKDDEGPIRASVAEARQKMYARPAETATFNAQGMLLYPPALPPIDRSAQEQYLSRYVDFFGTQALAGKKIVFYQHSAVGRDMLVDLLRQLGAEVVPVDRADHFIPVDSENVTPDDQAHFHKLASDHPDALAIVSTDGDSDRPFVIDEQGIFHRGDILGAVVATWLKADFAAFPVSSNDALQQYLDEQNIPWQHTKIGSPYVIAAMEAAAAADKKQVVGWEVNGGFLLGTSIIKSGKQLSPLPTRDAILPIIVALLAATEQGLSVSALFQKLPKRFTGAGLINNFPVAVSQSIIKRYQTADQTAKHELAQYFTAEDGFGSITNINTLDGIRLSFDNGDIAHLRPSGNAPQLRIYSVANNQTRADQIVALALQEPEGIFRQLEKGSKD